ncbi:MAG: hypothetical protein EOO07_00630 [Chitinophagaceae bacterium]|nr:MAG: hypothetical protein EOO07_00630 [Chitinophagaceae bacterium]
MKKSILVLIALFTINLACKKENIGGGGLCACTQISYVGLNLVIKNTSNQDLLNPSTPNSFSVSHIQLFKKAANGDKIAVSFSIRKPFDYPNGKFEYFQIFSNEIGRITNSIGDTYYLKLGEQEPHVLNLGLNNASKKTDRLLIDGKEAPKEATISSDYPFNIFYLVKP